MDSILQQIDWNQLLITVLTIVAGSAGLSKFKFGQQLIARIIESLRDKQSPVPVPVSLSNVDGSGEMLPDQKPSSEAVAYVQALQGSVKRAPKEFLFDLALAGRTLYEARGDWDEHQEAIRQKLNLS